MRAPARYGQALRVIGVLESDFREKFGAPRQPALVPAATARLRIGPEFIPEQSFKGLDGFSHVWLIGYLHLNVHKAFKSTVHPPRLGGGTVGVFASRSPHRPSALGLSVARLDAVRGDTLHLSGVDFVDGTPILDVKPYIASYDAVPDARSGWAGAAAAPRLTVRLTRAALSAARRRELRRPGLAALLRQALALDPRNPRDRSQWRPGRAHDVRLAGVVARFTIRGGTVTVSSLRADQRSTRKLPNNAATAGARRSTLPASPKTLIR